MKFWSGIVISVLSMLLVSVSYAKQLATGSSAPNELYEHASPYLALHGRDPVQWREWNAETVALAKKENKLLFVSSGYFSCHWCHVMQKESYQNEAIAKVINDNYIPVKVDRELNSALDSHLIDFVERTQGIAGWPLNVFITPDGYPLVGMVYVPPENFLQVLNAMNLEWKENRIELEEMAKDASAVLSEAEVTNNITLTKDLYIDFINAFLNQAFTITDEMQGGFGQENKFPQVPQLLTLIEIYKIHPNEQIGDFLQLTLDQMADNGLRDQLNGGFYRYSVDPGWQVPHFEKMLYDNALLSILYLEAAIVFDNKSYEQVAIETLEFVMREMSDSGGLYISSLSAVDNKGIEGGYYLWDVDELKKILTDLEFRIASLYWGLDGVPELDDGHHLQQSMTISDISSQTGIAEVSIKNIVRSARSKMVKHRDKRNLPVDNKQLTAWNGLMLTAFVKAYEQTKQQRYLDQASIIVNNIYTKLWKDDELKRYVANNRSMGHGELDDYAYIAQGMYHWWRVTGRKQDEQFIKKILTVAWSEFYGKQGWILAEDMLLKYSQGSTLVSDGPMFSAAAVLTRVSYDFGKGIRDKELVEQSLKSMNVGHDEIRYNPFFHATQISSIMNAQSATK